MAALAPGVMRLYDELKADLARKAEEAQSAAYNLREMADSASNAASRLRNALVGEDDFLEVWGDWLYTPESSTTTLRRVLFALEAATTFPCWLGKEEQDLDEVCRLREELRELTEPVLPSEAEVVQFVEAVQEAEVVLEALQESLKCLKKTTRRLRDKRTARDVLQVLQAEAVEVFERLGERSKTMTPSQLKMSPEHVAVLPILAEKGVLGVVKGPKMRSPRYYLL